jgi:hypothetical protein
MMIMGLGLIPAWQFSQDPNINPKINPNVHYPAGVYQTTVQPIGPYYQQWYQPPITASGNLGAAGPRVMLMGPPIQFLGPAMQPRSWWKRSLFKKYR